jgi:hypothetical protein
VTVLLHRVNNVTMREMEIWQAAEVGFCSGHPAFSPFGFACAKFSLFCWTCFGTVPSSAYGSELLTREAIRASPQAERACQEAAAVDRSAARKILHRRSEPYNRGGLHAKSLVDESQSFDQR